MICSYGTDLKSEGWPQDKEKLSLAKAQQNSQCMLSLYCYAFIHISNNSNQKKSHEFERDYGGSWEGLEEEDMGDVCGGKGK